MRIERLQVEEGFLDGLDLRFEPGLNVLIGARGSGKTSIIELIRFCLGAPSFTETGAHTGQQQALSVLGSGRVTVTLLDDGDRLVVSRAATGPKDIEITGLTVLAQNEIEAVGTHAGGRLHVVDRYRQQSSAKEWVSVVAQLRSTTTELRSVLTEMLHLTDQIESLSSVPETLEAARQRQSELLESIAGTQEERARLENLQGISGALSSARVVLERGEANVSQLGATLAAVPDPLILLEPWPPDAQSSDPLIDARDALTEARQRLAEASGAVASAGSILNELLEDNRRQRGEVDNHSRSLRAELNALQEGAGEVTRRVDALREQAGQLDALKDLLASRQTRGQDLFNQRRALFEVLDGHREVRFKERAAIAQRLNDELDPRIRVELRRSAGRSEYVAAIVGALRGSGIHYNDLAPQIAAAVTPLELLELSETGNAAQLASLVGISQQRAQSVVQHLRMADTTEIVAAPIEDSAEFFLLDGSDYKATSQLSIGQRCTVILPLLLSQHGDVLIVDQPEDHIDNAFIASTLVSTLRARHPSDQFLFSSHNPNIPVLAEADLVIHMDSDGKRGFVRTAGPLEDPGVVDAITSVMEGGTAAFDTRARFYAGDGAESGSPR